MSTEPREKRLQLRVSAQQRDVIERAAEASHETLTDYVIRHAVAAAKNDLADRSFFAIDAAAWTEFQRRLNQAPVHKPELEKLFSEPEPWEN